MGGFSGVGSQIMGQTTGSMGGYQTNNAYNTAQSRGPMSNNMGGGDAAGFYTSNQYSDFDQRTEAGMKKRRVHDLIEMGKRFVHTHHERKLHAERL